MGGFFQYLKSFSSTSPILNESPLISTTREEIDYEALPEDSSLIAQLSAGAFAGVMEHTLMYPVDVIKTRMQLFLSSSTTTTNQQLLKTYRPGIFGTIVKITNLEGPLALWRGVSSVLIGAGPAHAIYFGVFEYSKTLLVNNFIKTNQNSSNFLITDESHPLVASFAGISATIASDFLMTPFDVIKQRMQALKSLNSNSNQFNYNFYSVTKQIIKNEGLGALWVSYPATIFLNIPFAALNFGIYEYSSLILNPEHHYNPLNHCLSGAIAGAFAAGITNPLDFIKTFMQTKNLSKDVKIRSIDNKWLSVVKFLIKKENGGYKNFLKGLKPRVIFNVPSTAISWTSYEMAKSYLCS